MLRLSKKRHAEVPSSPYLMESYQSLGRAAKAIQVLYSRVKPFSSVVLFVGQE